MSCNVIGINSLDMNENEEIFISSTNSSVDSGLDNDYLSDNYSSSSNGEPQSVCVLRSILKVRHQTFERDSKHSCVLNCYDISGKGIESICPRTFQYLTYCVTELNLSSNKIQVLPETICFLENLEKLNLSCNKIQNVPESWKALWKLKILNLSSNELKEAPKCLETGMGRLTKIDLSNNKISKFLKSPKCLYFLQYLNLSRNCLSSLPLWLFTEQCRSLEELDMSFNLCFNLKTDSSRIASSGHLRTSVMKSLKKLNIYNTGSRMDMIDSLSHFESLESYFMGNETIVFSRTDDKNHFWDLPIEFFYNPKTVVELHLPNVGLAGLPNNICKLENLKVLDVSQNLIDWLPDSFGSLKSLEELNLSDCKLAYLPKNFNQLSNLKKLLLEHNQLTDVRNNLSGLSSLEWLDIYNNCLDEFPISPEHLLTLKKLDVAVNYVNVEEVLHYSVDGICLLDVYCHLQANLRSSTDLSIVDRLDGHKISSSSSIGSYYKDYYCSDEDSIYSHGNEYQETKNEQVEENWDEESNDDDTDRFDPSTLSRYTITPGSCPFGWIPPNKEYEFNVPFSLLLSGFVYVPGKTHLSSQCSKRELSTLPIVDCQFDDRDVHCALDEEKRASLLECIKKKHMFVRNPLGVKRRTCTKCGKHYFCWHNGIWSRF